MSHGDPDDSIVAPRVRRLGPADGPVLAALAREDAEFDVAGRGAQLPTPSPEAARAFLEDPNVLFWIAEHGETVTGLLYCNQLRIRDSDRPELLLYEIGVRSAFRRRRVGRFLLDAMRAWMQERQIKVCWVLADNPGAVAFYEACGFEIAAPAPTYMVLDREP